VEGCVQRGWRVVKQTPAEVRCEINSIVRIDLTQNGSDVHAEGRSWREAWTRSGQLSEEFYTDTRSLSGVQKLITEAAGQP
jgi:hypothetical protein